mgnify:CR=1 FL=1
MTETGESYVKLRQASRFARAEPWVSGLNSPSKPTQMRSNVMVYHGWVNPHDLNVAKEITKCRSIISSSLHGIIAAHAYNIPAAWVNFGIMKGDGIKFEDHYLSLGLDPVQSDMENPIFTTGVFNTTQIDDIFKSVK